jgi:multimeric flavodoxin WrbA
MKIIAVNASPRRNGSTAELLSSAVDGARGEGSVEVELFNLYDLDFHGCYSCFSCKRLGGASYGRCAMRDGLTSLIDTIVNDADGLIVGTPIYFGSANGALRSFLERLVFPLNDYQPDSHLLGRTIPVGFIYTMNAERETAERLRYAGIWEQTQKLCERYLGSYEQVISYDTYQYSDYDKFSHGRFDPLHKAYVREERFPLDRKASFELGRSIALQASAAEGV